MARRGVQRLDTAWTKGIRLEKHGLHQRLEIPWGVGGRQPVSARDALLDAVGAA